MILVKALLKCTTRYSRFTIDSKHIKICEMITLSKGSLSLKNSCCLTVLSKLSVLGVVEGNGLCH